MCIRDSQEPTSHAVQSNLPGNLLDLAKFESRFDQFAPNLFLGAFAPSAVRSHLEFGGSIAKLAPVKFHPITRLRENLPCSQSPQVGKGILAKHQKLILQA